MRFIMMDHYRTARQTLERARTRTLLTITGVSIGVASITAILSLSGGVTALIEKQVEGLGKTIAVVRPTPKLTSLTDISNPISQVAYTTSPISEEDVDAVRSLPETQAAAPIMTISGSVRTRDRRPQYSTLVASSPELETISKLNLQDGQFIDSVTLDTTAVVGAQLAVDLFGTEDAIGKTFLVRGQAFTVIGVLKRENSPVNYNGIDFDYAAIISLKSGKLFNNGVAQIQQINILAKPGTDMVAYRKKLANELNRRHDGQHDVSVYTGADIATPTNQFFSAISTVMSIIAGISLFVGGIGIMNIMLVSVSERTREIGLRKAVGASNGTIIWQFLIEALIMSLIGGALGYLGGYLIAFFISMFIPYDPILNWEIAAVAAVLSIGVGVLFGLYPAIRAASKDPIESLRRYH